jgi:D-tyrosyl-tRNA(Tyr) deacylase
MRVVVQRISQAAVGIGEETISAVGSGLLLYVAFRTADTDRDLAWMAEKVAHLRIFEDADGKLNRSVLETGGEVLVVSEFTLYGDARRGRRPSFDASAPAAVARPLFAKFVDKLSAEGLIIRTGRFQATMQVQSVNDGPVTLVLDTPEGREG